MAVEITKFGPGIFTIGETASAEEFGGHVTEMTLEPEHESDDDLPTLDGEVIAGDFSTKWTAKPTFVQSYLAGSLVAYCAANNGKRLPFRFVPSTDGVLEITGTLEVRAVTIGGEVKKKNTTQGEFPVIGDPVIGDTYTATV